MHLIRYLFLIFFMNGYYSTELSALNEFKGSCSYIHFSQDNLYWNISTILIGVMFMTIFEDSIPGFSFLWHCWQGGFFWIYKYDNLYIWFRCWTLALPAGRMQRYIAWIFFLSSSPVGQSALKPLKFSFNDDLEISL